jgi:hypothetical protein
LIENVVNIFVVTSFIKIKKNGRYTSFELSNDHYITTIINWSCANKIIIYIYIKSKGIHQPGILMSNESSRHDDAAQTK